MDAEIVAELAAFLARTRARMALGPLTPRELAVLVGLRDVLAELMAAVVAIGVRPGSPEHVRAVYRRLAAASAVGAPVS